MADDDEQPEVDGDGIIADETHHMSCEAYRDVVALSNRVIEEAKTLAERHNLRAYQVLALLQTGPTMQAALEFGKAVTRAHAARLFEVPITSPHDPMLGGTQLVHLQAGDPCPECSWKLHQHHSGNLACDRCGTHFAPAYRVPQGDSRG